ncbi:hypothetical protein [Streptomyces sp. NPDC059076]|uniref:nSTAND1 domain-containing NTPase n=1 Tax=unclassified Streptomyces TaxID=2593676 RepID=UPI0036D0B588
MTDAAMLVGPMTRAELRETIVGPAQAAELIVERELTARLVVEVEGEPGGLPLLAHALRETWRRRRGRALTAAAYEASGVVHGAIAQTAEETFAELSDERRGLARLIPRRHLTPDGAPRRLRLRLQLRRPSAVLTAPGVGARVKVLLRARDRRSPLGRFVSTSFGHRPRRTRTWPQAAHPLARRSRGAAAAGDGRGP